MLSAWMSAILFVSFFNFQFGCVNFGADYVTENHCLKACFKGCGKWIHLLLLFLEFLRIVVLLFLWASWCHMICWSFLFWEEPVIHVFVKFLSKQTKFFSLGIDLWFIFLNHCLNVFLKCIKLQIVITGGITRWEKCSHWSWILFL